MRLNRWRASDIAKIESNKKFIGAFRSKYGGTIESGKNKIKSGTKNKLRFILNFDLFDWIQVRSVLIVG